MWVDSFSRFHIDAIIQGGSREAWRFTGFYGEPNTNEREEAWNMLRMLHSKPHLPWVCMGDFNEILLSEEKRGGGGGGLGQGLIVRCKLFGMFWILVVFWT